MSHLTVLAAGYGGARFLAGLVDVRNEEDVHVVANVGSDSQTWGLRCCPDIDLILNTLSGEVDAFQADQSAGTYQCFEAMRQLGAAGLEVPDRQLATRLIRTSLLNAGENLEAATLLLAERFGVGIELMPSTNDPLETVLHTESDGPLRPLDYQARGNEALQIESVTYEGASGARASQRVVDSILGATRVIVAPGQPRWEVGALLAIGNLRDALVRTRASVVAISPIIGSRSIWDERPQSGNSHPEESSVVQFADSLRGTIDSLVIHTTDLGSLDAVRETGIDAWADNILIDSREAAGRLAGRVAYEGRLVARKR